MRILLILISISISFAADEQQLALTIRAQTDFDRVALPAIPQLQDTARCIQSQAALLAVAPRPEVSVAHFRKGYCTLASATITGSGMEFADAVAEFDKAIEAWSDRMPRNSKTTEPVSSGLRILAAIARIRARPGEADLARVRQEISAALQPPVCPSNIMPMGQCEALLQTGREWLGWMALESDDLSEAAQEFSAAPETAWAVWTAGRQSFGQGKYAEAAAHYRKAVDLWNAQQGSLPVMARLEPQPKMALALTDLGGAQILAGDPAAAVRTLDAAVKADPDLARSIYLRARAKELAGQSGPALADYSLASRTAFAKAQDLASGEAHLYRGIMLYRRNDYSHAEEEFASALNFDISPQMRPDAAAWRHLAAVAGGACGDSRARLEQSLGQVSPYFPKPEARRRADSCPVSSGWRGPTSEVR